MEELEAGTAAWVENEYAALRNGAAAWLDRLENLVRMGQDPKSFQTSTLEPGVAIHLNEAERRMEDAVNRVSNLMSYLMMQTPEGKQRAAEQAVKEGRVIAGPGSNNT